MPTNPRLLGWALIALLCSAGTLGAAEAWQPDADRLPLVTVAPSHHDVQPTAAMDGKQSPAIVRVWADTGGGSRSGGSGTLLAKDETGRGLIVTNRHVVSGGNGFRIHWPTGDVSDAELIGVGAGEVDLAALFVDVPDGVEPAPLREEEPADGETLFIAGYGGSSEGFSFGDGDYRPVNDADARIEGTPARHGDSGGPIIDAQGRVSGVLWGSNFHDHTVCIRLPRVRAFLRGVGQLTKWAVGPCCSGGASSSSRSGRRNPIDVPEILGGNGIPDDIDEPGLPGDERGEPQPAPKSEHNQVAELESQLEKLTKRLAELEKQKDATREPGPAGPQGPAGPAGPPGPPGKDADDALALALMGRIDALEKQLATAAPPVVADQQPAPVGGLTGTPKISHIVLLVDKSAPDWARIEKTFLSRAQDVLPVQVVDYSEVPWKVRQLPQAIVYNTAHEAVSVAKGSRNVELTLAAADRGDLK